MDTNPVFALVPVAVAVGAFVLTCVIAVVMIGWHFYQERLHNQQLKAIKYNRERSVDPDSKFMQSGVWGRNTKGEVVDLRIHDPKRAARALGLRRRKSLMLVDESVTHAGLPDMVRLREWREIVH